MGREEGRTQGFPGGVYGLYIWSVSGIYLVMMAGARIAVACRSTSALDLFSHNFYPNALTLGGIWVAGEANRVDFLLTIRDSDIILYGSRVRRNILV
jgi:hypothetical protein